MAPEAAQKRRKQFRLDAALAAAVESFARDTRVSMDDLAGEAFRDLLKKKQVPVGLADALKASTRSSPANDRVPAEEPGAPLKRSSRKR